MDRPNIGVQRVYELRAVRHRHEALSEPSSTVACACGAVGVEDDLPQLCEAGRVILDEGERALVAAAGDVGPVSGCCPHTEGRVGE